MPRQRLCKPVTLDPKTGQIVGNVWSGALMADLARTFAPSADEARGILIALRRDFKLARGHMAAVLGVAEGTVRAWESGACNPSMGIRRLIWFVDLSFRGQPAPGLMELLTWGRSVPSGGTVPEKKSQ